MNDLRFAFRQLAKAPGFTAVAVLTLAVGIGAVTAMFSALQAMVVQPFSYPQADRLVHVWSKEGQPLSAPDFLDIKAQATAFAEFGVYSPQRTNVGGEHVESVRSVACTPGVLRALGIAPVLGRWLTEADDEKGAPYVAVISYRLWQQAFAADPELIGRTIRLNGDNTTVVGVMPKTFEFASPWMRTNNDCDVWQPLRLDREKNGRGSHWLCALGRLKAGVTVAAADTEIKAIGARLKAAYPNENARKPFLVRSLYDEMTHWYRSQVWMLFSAVTLVLLVACANVASMLLARAARRHGEFGVRLALGATRIHLLRFALGESVWLAVGGSLAGLGVALAAIPILRSLAPVGEARRLAMVLDTRALAFAIGLGVLSALLAGLPPALAALRISVVDLLRVDSRAAAGSRTRQRVLRTLIVTQVAVAFVLANGAALFSASYAKLLGANANLATDHVLSAQLDLRGDRYLDKAARLHLWEQISERLAAVPGVSAVGLASKLPLEGGNNLNVLVDDEVFEPALPRSLVEVTAITPAYFSAVGMTLLRGRTLQPGDGGEDEINVVINRAFAEKSWPGADPLGKVFRPNSSNAWFHAHVVGVVENVRQKADEQPRRELYWTPDHAWGVSIFLLVRSAQPPTALTPALRRAIAEIDPDLPLARVRTLRTVLDEVTEGQRALMKLVNGFMAIALGLVAIGLYGTLSYHVLQRTREIGVRMALGAARSDILHLILRQGYGWTALGVTLGVTAALALTRTLKSMVYGMESADPAALLAATGVIAAATLFACWLPARRATRVNPIKALRIE